MRNAAEIRLFESSHSSFIDGFALAFTHITGLSFEFVGKYMHDDETNLSGKIRLESKESESLASTLAMVRPVYSRQWTDDSCGLTLAEVIVPIRENGCAVAALRTQPFSLVSGQRYESIQSDPASPWAADKRHDEKEPDLFKIQTVVSRERADLALQLLKALAWNIEHRAKRSTAVQSTVEPSNVVQAKRFILANASGTITPQDVARYVRLNLAYLCRLFKKITGSTLSEHISLVRLERAKILLGNPGLTITEVAYESGFGCIPHFNRLFRLRLGMSPSQYRRMLGVAN